ncbi:MAG: STAS domain-containing protein [Acidobacteriia bacterium]|nr:STAS domain-containing protein [Terriglobia bacterium]
MPITISESVIGSVTVVILKGTLVAGGDIDLLNSTVQALVQRGVTGIILDLGEVNYLDSSGIGALIRAYSYAVQNNAAVKLCRLTRRVHDVLQIARLSSAFEIFNDVEKAAASFEKKAA